MNDIVKADNNVVQRTSDEIKLIHDTYAKNTTETEFKLFLYAADRYGLDPLLKQIWCVKFANQPAQIYAGRDGFLEVAHRSGQFNGIESGMKDDKTAYAKVYRKDMDNPFYVEVSMSEYATGQALWKSKPNTMLIKVAESQALRRAFSISGIYSPEEMGQWECEAQGIKFEKTGAIPTQQSDSGYDRSKEDPNAKPKSTYNTKTKKYYCGKTARLYVIATKENGYTPDEFKELCIEVTGKDHSKDYTNQDCWDIEDEMARRKFKDADDIVEADDSNQDELEPEVQELLDKEVK